MNEEQNQARHDGAPTDLSDSLRDLIADLEAGLVSNELALQVGMLTAVAGIAGTLREIRDALTPEPLAPLEVGGIHELRLIAHNHYGESGIHPYCPCGWVGNADYIGEGDTAASRYRDHLEDQS